MDTQNFDELKERRQLLQDKEELIYNSAVLLADLEDTLDRICASCDKLDRMTAETGGQILPFTKSNKT